MATVLRRSGQLGRLSRTSLLRSSQLSLRTARPSILAQCSIPAQRVQHFASKTPKPPKDNGNNNDNDNSQKPSEEKPTENENKKEEVEETKKESEPKQPELPPGFVAMNAELTEALNTWGTEVHLLLPRKLQSRKKEILALISKGAIAEKLAGLLLRNKAGETLNVLEVSRLMRLMADAERKLDGKANNSDYFFLPGTDNAADGIFQPNPWTRSQGSGDNKGQGKSQGEGEKKGQNQGESGQQWNPFPGGKLPKDYQTIAYVVGAYIVFELITPSGQSRDITWQELQSAFLDKGLVEKLTVVNGDRVRVDLHRDLTKSMYPDSPAVNPRFNYYFTIGSTESFERKLEEAQDDLGIPHSQRIPVSYVRETSWASVAMNLGPTLLLIGGSLWLLKRVSGGAGGGSSGVFGMGKSKAKMFNQERDIKVKFADVAGMDEAKVEIMEFVSFLKNPSQYERLGAKIPRGAILSGPPGTGKTLLAKATAGESGVPFFSVSGSEFVEMFVGVGPSRVRDLFAQARKNTPCIIFIDEIDAIGKARSKNNFGGGGNDERESTLNQILTEMDGFNTQEQVVVLAGTNRPDTLDSALMRPGRFDRHISIDRPTMEGRKQIFNVHLKKIVTNEDMEYLKGRLAALTPGFSGADIANCCNEAALIAARQQATSVAMTHFEQAIERVIGGLEKKSLVLSAEDKKTVAYHEAGHAICGWYFKYADPLLKVSIIPRGQGALGYAQYLPSSDTYLMNTKQLMDRMAMTLGGRVSEELHFETVTSGASDDFNKVTRMATAMVTKWGMSKKVGYLHFEDDQNKFQKPFAESTAQTIDAEVRRIIDEAYKQCKDLLTEKKKEVGLVAEELLKKEVLVRDDLVRILGKRPFGDPKDFEQYFGGDAAAAPNGGKSAPPPPPQERDSPLDTPEYPGQAAIFDGKAADQARQ